MKKLDLLAAIWSPTDSAGKLLKADFERQLAHLKQHKVDGIVPGGSTGEFPYLRLETRKELLIQSVQHASPMRIIYNVSDVNPFIIRELIDQANHQPIAGILLLPPIYYPHTDADLVEYFVQMGKLSKHPVYLYNFPEMTKVVLTIEIIDAISKRLPLAGIKQSGADLNHLAALHNWAKGKSFTVFAGNDLCLPEALSLGVTACIGGLVPAIPELLSHSDHPATAPKLKKLGKILSRLPYPHNVSALLEARSLPVGVPKMPLSASSREIYHQMISEFRQFLDE